MKKNIYILIYTNVLQQITIRIIMHIYKYSFAKI